MSKNKLLNKAREKLNSPQGKQMLDSYMSKSIQRRLDRENKLNEFHLKVQQESNYFQEFTEEHIEIYNSKEYNDSEYNLGYQLRISA